MFVLGMQRIYRRLQKATNRQTSPVHVTARAVHNGAVAGSGQIAGAGRRGLLSEVDPIHRDLPPMPEFDTQRKSLRQTRLLRAPNSLVSVSIAAIFEPVWAR